MTSEHHLVVAVDWSLPWWRWGTICVCGRIQCDDVPAHWNHYQAEGL